ncbi:RICIN domain-containing protein [Streptomyces sp. NPDC092129]|uniref:RICIN domain-containing protein n=1 Tax=Streptomyces sp. NPDC092129 TaxID=3366010 RepID=UPI00382003F8
MLKKTAALGAATLLCWALGTAQASATSSYRHLRNVGAVGECLDFRADPEYGVYTTGCNEGAYQTWTMATLPETATALRQNAGSRLCLVARSGQPTMKPCLAGDQAALWTVHDLGPSTTGYQIINKATGTCLIAGSGAIHHVSLGACAGGGSRQWIVYS